MSRNKSKLTFLVLLATLLLGVYSSAQALETPPGWFEHDFATVRILAESSGDGEKHLHMDGLLRFAYPDGFEIQYLTQTAPVVITSQAGFVQVQTGADVQYGYDSYWLFADLQTYVFGLVELSRRPLAISGQDRIADRRALRYVDPDSDFVAWFDEESRIPFLVRSGSETLLTINSYILENHELTQVELELCFGPKAARLTLEAGEEGWAPAMLEIEEAQGVLTLKLFDWAYQAEWENNPLPRLARLDELNQLFLVEFQAQNYDKALSITQEMLALAPQFWQVYLYQAFVYEGIDNYLGVVENYQQVLMRQPDNHLALNNLAYHYFLKEVQIPHALEMAKRAVELERKDIYLDTLGYGYYLVGRYAEAKELLLEALETVGEDAQAEVQGHLDLVLQALGENGHE